LSLQLLEHSKSKPYRVTGGDNKNSNTSSKKNSHGEDSVREEGSNENSVNDWTPDVIFGNYSMPITFDPKSSNNNNNSNSAAVIQKAFDVGLMECYGFAFFEARKTIAKLLLLAHDDSSSSLLENGNNAKHDTTKFYCPMCHWLLAMGHSPYINHPIISDPSDFQAASKASDVAFAQAHHIHHDPPMSNAISNAEGSHSNRQLSNKEIGLIDAMHLRFSPPSSFEHQTIGYELYKNQLRDLHEQLLLRDTHDGGGGGDADVMAFLADSIMVLHADANGYEFYDKATSEPKPEIAYAISLLENCLEISPDHPLCQHLYIHITEPSDQMVAFSGPVATNLAAKTKGKDAQHLQHMPSHSFLRIGRYHDAVRSGTAAHDSDQRYEQQGAVAYGPAHDLVVLVHSAGLSGEKSVALSNTDALRDHYEAHPGKPDGPGTEAGWHVWRTTRLRFGEFAAVLEDGDAIPTGGSTSHSHVEKGNANSDAPIDRPYAVVLGHYSKGVASLWNNNNNNNRNASAAPAAQISQDRLLDAKHHQEKLRTVIPSVDRSFRGMTFVTDWTLEASIQYYEILVSHHVDPSHHQYYDESKGYKQILGLLRSACAEQEHWTYTEPPPWYASLRLCEGTLLRIMGRYEESVQAFEADLERLPENRYGLYGLWKALEEEGTADNAMKAREVRDRFERSSSWADASVKEQPPLVCPELGE
jgi:tetratricopeptide (TPR) repeat protein